MREKIYKEMVDLMQNNCVCNYVITQGENEKYVKDIHALDVYMKAYEMSENGDVECYMAALGKENKAVSPVFSVINGTVILSGKIIK